MSVTPRDFLDSAIGLAGTGCDEMTQRNAISRAYYSAYHCSCEFIEPEDSDEKVGVHKRYITQLMRGENGSIERKIGGKIKSMYVRRRVADYFLKDDIKNDATALQLYAARELFTIIESAKNGASISGKNQPPLLPPTLRIIK